MKNRPMRLDIVAFSAVPVLFILGKQDSRIPLDKGMAQASTARNSQMVILGDSGHMGWAEEPEKTIAALQGFMKFCLAPINR
jgi:pimeloyl-ACP methyl ester carboxylesterase